MTEIIPIIAATFIALLLFKFLKSITKTLISATVIGLLIYVIMRLA